jgi:hypothetical protein
MTPVPRLLSRVEEDGVLVIPRLVRITQVLGRLSVTGASLSEDRQPAQNSSRWVFDIEGKTGTDIEIKLLEYRSGRPLFHELVSPSLTPLCSAFYAAKPFFILEPGRITLRTEKTSETCAYRVSIDAIHSTTR